MKSSIFTSALVSSSILSSDGFSFVARKSASLRSATQLDATSIIFGTIGGNTELIAGYISEATGISPILIDDASDSDFTGSDSLIVGCPTWNTGADEQRSMTGWDEWLYDNMNSIDLKGKKVAFFGVGDQMSYMDNYCDAVGELYDRFTEKGCTAFGMTSTDGYSHSESKSEIDGKFVGLVCDQDNQDDMSEDRAKAWVEQLKTEGFF